MSITSKTRKILWGKSGNKCSICKKDLSTKVGANPQHTILGEECHIVSPKSGGPRNDSLYSKKSLNLYDNLILLCSEHHKIIDDNVNEYPIEKLIGVKRTHESWVMSSLTEETKPMPDKIIVPSKKVLLQQTMSGREVVDLCCSACSYHFGNDDPNTEEELHLIQDLFSLLEDCDVISDQASAVTQTAFEVTKIINALFQKGYVTMVTRQMAKITGGYKKEAEPWPIVYVVVRKLSNVIKDNLLNSEAQEIR